MTKMTQKIFTSSLVILLTVGLGGCALNGSTTTNKANHATNAKVVKDNNHSKNNDHKAASSTKDDSNSNTESSYASSSSVVTNDHSNATSQGYYSTPAVTTNAESSSTSAITSNTKSSFTPVITNEQGSSQQTGSLKEHQEIQLGLGDVAIWTDDHGITHHVDSDGMDRQTTAGSEEVYYQDWSGSLPTNAKVIHNN